MKPSLLVRRDSSSSAFVLGLYIVFVGLFCVNDLIDRHRLPYSITFLLLLAWAFLFDAVTNYASEQKLYTPQTLFSLWRLPFMLLPQVLSFVLLMIIHDFDSSGQIKPFSVYALAAAAGTVIGTVCLWVRKRRTGAMLNVR